MEIEDSPDSVDSEEYGPEEELEPTSRMTSDAGTIDTDDLEDELAKRKRKRRGHARTWQYILASSLTGLFAGGAPSVYGWIDARADKLRAEATVEALATEKLTNEASYRQLSDVLSSHARDLDACKRDLDNVRIELAVMGEWKRIVEQRLNNRFNLRVPSSENVARMLSLDPRIHPPAAKPDVERPEVKKGDPRVEQMKIEILNGSAY